MRAHKPVDTSGDAVDELAKLCALSRRCSGAEAMTLSDGASWSWRRCGEYRMIGLPNERQPLVMLHEARLPLAFGPFPETLAAATGAGVLVYSRANYGRSVPGDAAALHQLHGRGGARRTAARARSDRL